MGGLDINRLDDRNIGAPSGGRTHTGRILSPLSLPLDYGARKALPHWPTPFLTKSDYPARSVMVSESK